MKEPYVEGLASHHGPGSYAVSREAEGGALIGVRAGWVMSPEISVERADVVRAGGRQYAGRRYARRSGATGVRDPKHARNHLA